MQFYFVCTKIRLLKNVDNEQIRDESWRPRSLRPIEETSAPWRIKNKQ